MSKKATIGGLLGLVVLVGAIFFCIWAGQKIDEKLSEINPNAPTPAPEQPIPNEPSAPTKQPHLALGNPGNASVNPDNYLLENDFYALSYNRKKAIPNWVAWRLTKSDFGNADRQNDYRPDDRLPADWQKITPFDYSGSGFDRGHLCPSADRSSSVRANSETFLMTNMTPQTPELNQGAWEKLESYSRSMVRRNMTLYIFAGQYGERGKVKNKITIPTNFWKIIVVLPNNANISTINLSTRVIAVDMPNAEDIKNKNWREYKTTVQQIERKTGYKFFTNLSEDLRNTLITKYDSRND
jgi:endonuclease G